MAHRHNVGKYPSIQNKGIATNTKLWILLQPSKKASRRGNSSPKPNNSDSTLEQSGQDQSDGEEEALACGVHTGPQQRLCCWAELWEAGPTPKRTVPVFLGWMWFSPCYSLSPGLSWARGHTNLTTSDSLPSGEGAA